MKVQSTRFKVQGRFKAQGPRRKPGAAGCWLVVALLWVGGWQAPASVVEGRGFKAGNALYQSGDFAGAVAAYEAQAGRGEYSANLFYNLGDAYFRRGDRGRAALNYERALALEPSHAEAAANLAFLRGKPVAAAGFWNTDTLTILGAAAGWLGALGLTAGLLLRWARATGFAVAAGGLLACGALAAAVWYLDGGVDRAARAVVLADGTPALYAPADDAKVVTTLLAGADVRVLSDQGAWTYALLPDGARAWVATGKIEKLVPSR